MACCRPDSGSRGAKSLQHARQCSRRARAAVHRDPERTLKHCHSACGGSHCTRLAAGMIFRRKTIDYPLSKTASSQPLTTPDDCAHPVAGFSTRKTQTKIEQECLAATVPVGLSNPTSSATSASAKQAQRRLAGQNPAQSNTADSTIPCLLSDRVNDHLDSMPEIDRPSTLYFEQSDQHRRVLNERSDLENKNCLSPKSTSLEDKLIPNSRMHSTVKITSNTPWFIKNSYLASVRQDWMHNNEVKVYSAQITYSVNHPLPAIPTADDDGDSSFDEPLKTPASAASFQRTRYMSAGSDKTGTDVDFDMSSLIDAYGDDKSIKTANSVPLSQYVHLPDLSSTERGSSATSSDRGSAVNPSSPARSSHQMRSAPASRSSGKPYIPQDESSDAVPEMRAPDRSFTNSVLINSQRDRASPTSFTHPRRSVTAPVNGQEPTSRVDLNRVATMTKNFMAEELAVLDSIGNFDFETNVAESLKKLEARKPERNSALANISEGGASSPDTKPLARTPSAPFSFASSSRRTTLEPKSPVVERKSSTNESPVVERKPSVMRSWMSSSSLSTLLTTTSKEKVLPSVPDPVVETKETSSASPSPTSLKSPGNVVPRKQIPRKPLPMSSPVALNPPGSVLSSPQPQQQQQTMQTMTPSPTPAHLAEQGSPSPGEQKMRRKFFGRSSGKEHKRSASNGLSSEQKGSNQIKSKLRDFMQMDALGVTPATRDQVPHQLHPTSTPETPKLNNERGSFEKVNSPSSGLNKKLGLKGLRGKFSKKHTTDVDDAENLTVSASASASPAPAQLGGDLEIDGFQHQPQKQQQPQQPVQQHALPSVPRAGTTFFEDNKPIRQPVRNTSGLGIDLATESATLSRQSDATSQPVSVPQPPQQEPIPQQQRPVLRTSIPSSMYLTLDDEIEYVSDDGSRPTTPAVVEPRAGIPQRNASLATTATASDAGVNMNNSPRAERLASISSPESYRSADSGSTATGSNEAKKSAASTSTTATHASTFAIDTRQSDAQTDPNLSDLGGYYRSIALNESVVPSESYGSLASSAGKKSMAGSERVSEISEQKSEDFLDALEDQPNLSAPAVSSKMSLGAQTLSEEAPVEMKKDLSLRSLMRRKRRSSMPEWSPIATMFSGNAPGLPLLDFEIERAIDLDADENSERQGPIDESSSELPFSEKTEVPVRAAEKRGLPLSAATDRVAALADTNKSKAAEFKLGDPSQSATARRRHERSKSDTEVAAFVPKELDDDEKEEEEDEALPVQPVVAPRDVQTHPRMMQPVRGVMRYDAPVNMQYMPQGMPRFRGGGRGGRGDMAGPMSGRMLRMPQEEYYLQHPDYVAVQRPRQRFPGQQQRPMTPGMMMGRPMSPAMMQQRPMSPAMHQQQRPMSPAMRPLPRPMSPAGMSQFRPNSPAGGMRGGPGMMRPQRGSPYMQHNPNYRGPPASKLGAAHAMDGDSLIFELDQPYMPPAAAGRRPDMVSPPGRGYKPPGMHQFRQQQPVQQSSYVDYDEYGMTMAIARGSDQDRYSGIARHGAAMSEKSSASSVHSSGSNDNSQVPTMGSSGTEATDGMMRTAMTPDVDASAFRPARRYPKY